MSDEEPGVGVIVYEPTGEVVARDDLPAIGRLAAELDDIEREAKRVKAALGDAIVEHWRTYGGSKTRNLPGVTATIGAETETSYDAERLEEMLASAGMPETAIREIVVPVYSLKVDATKAKQAAKANPKYAAALAACTTSREKTPSVAWKRTRG